MIRYGQDRIIYLFILSFADFLKSQPKLKEEMFDALYKNVYLGLNFSRLLMQKMMSSASKLTAKPEVSLKTKTGNLSSIAEFINRIDSKELSSLLEIIVRSVDISSHSWDFYEDAIKPSFPNVGDLKNKLFEQADENIQKLIEKYDELTAFVLKYWLGLIMVDGMIRDALTYKKNQRG